MTQQSNLESNLVYYPEAVLSDLDAGTFVAYPISGNRDYNFKYYKIPSFLLIGAAKCGTTELRNWLSIHPEIKTLGKECHFFDEVIDISQEWSRYVINPYFLISKDKGHLFRHQNIHTLEKTPGYFDKKNAGVPVPELVHRMLPSGKFLVILRNPRDRAYSSFQQNCRSLEVRSARRDYAHDGFTKVVQESLSRIQQGAKGPRIITGGHYAEHLETWFRYFSPDQIHIILREDFINKPGEVMDKILSFLGISPFDYRSRIMQNHRGLWILKSNHGKRTKANDALYEPMPELAKNLLDEHYKPWNDRLRQLVPSLNFDW